MGEQALGQRDPDEHRRARLARGGHDLLQRLMTEDVDDNLHACAAGVPDRLERLLAGLRAHPVGADPPLVDHVVEYLPDARGLDDLARRAVHLGKVDGFNAEVLPGAIVPGQEIVAAVGLGSRREPASRLRDHRESGSGVLGEEPADEAFRAAVAVDVRGLDEVDAGLARAAQSPGRLVETDLALVDAQLPRAGADDADLTPQRCERTIVHTTLLRPLGAFALPGVRGWRPMGQSCQSRGCDARIVKAHPPRARLAGVCASCNEAGDGRRPFCYSRFLSACGQVPVAFWFAGDNWQLHRG